eukprot:COSAG02_NODE_58399_length_277_cov_0.994382_2_plen_39_part_01
MDQKIRREINDRRTDSVVDSVVVPNCDDGSEYLDSDYIH